MADISSREYDYSVRESTRNPSALREELAGLGDSGWELVAILEKGLADAKETGWIIVSKKLIRGKE